MRRFEDAVKAMTKARWMSFISEDGHVSVGQSSDEDLLRAALDVLFPWVRTVEELDALEDGKYIVNRHGDVFVAEKAEDGTNWWFVAGNWEGACYSEQIALPARVLYLPGVENA